MSLRIFSKHLIVWFGWMLLATSGCTAEQDAPTEPDTQSKQTPCTEGRTVECPCSDGSTGIQQCQSDRTWSSCDCSADSPDAADDGRDAAADTGPSMGDDTGDDTTDENPTDAADGKSEYSPDPDNMLTNPSFEDETQSDECLPGWTCVTYNPSDAGTFSLDESEIHQGRRAVRWQGDDSPITIIKQAVDSERGRIYEVTAWVRRDSSETEAYIQVLFDGTDQVLASQEFPVEDGVGEWTKITAETRRAPYGTDQVRVNLTTEQTGGPVRWDATSLVDVTSEHDDPTQDCSDDADYNPTPVSGPAKIGGGPDYANRVCRSDADTVVSTLSDLEDALANANSGDVVFLSPDAEFDMGFNARLTIPSGVTLSGGRGCNCRAGALLYTDAIVKEDSDHETMLVAKSDARVTGLRVRGPRNERTWTPLDEQDHYWDGSGVDGEGSDIEIDNNEIWGFAHAGVNAGASTHIHHNFIHTMPRDGLGYGVVGGDELLIEYNYFNFVRHAVASAGHNSYTARYNHMGTNAIAHVFDVHRPGGETFDIHHNTVEVIDDDIANENVRAVTIRGTPSDTADIHHNWFYNPKEPRNQPTNSWTDEAIVQVYVDSWTNVDFWDNHYGSSDPGDCDIGAPRSGC